MKATALLSTASGLLVIACAACSGGGDRGEVTRKDYGKGWPLTVESATLHCRNSHGAGIGSVTITINGTEYGLNGTAKNSERWPDFPRSLWRDDPELGHGIKESIGPLIQKGLALC